MNEQRHDSEGLRNANKTLQDREAEINTGGPVTSREQKKAENERLNTGIQYFENVRILKNQVLKKCIQF